LCPHEESFFETSGRTGDLHARLRLAPAEDRSAPGTRSPGAGDLCTGMQALGRPKTIPRARTSQGIRSAPRRIAGKQESFEFRVPRVELIRKNKLSFSAHRDTERLLMFGDPGLDALAYFGIRRRGGFDSSQAHSRTAVLDAAVRAQETLFSEKALALHRREEIFEESRRIWMCRFFGDTDRMNTDNNGIGLCGPIHLGSLRPRVLYPMRSNNRHGKLAGHQKIGGVGVTRLRLGILLREGPHVFPSRLVSPVCDQ